MKNSNPNHTQEEKNKPIWKQWVKRFGVGGLIFFTVKGTITSLLIYFLGKNFWEIIKTYFTDLFQ